jgi:hypothetical protein
MGLLPCAAKHGVALEEGRQAVGVVADQHELAVGGDQHLAVLLEVAAYLLALGD